MKLLVVYSYDFGRKFVERAIPLAKDLSQEEIISLQKLLDAKTKFVKRTLSIIEPQDINGIETHLLRM